MSNPTRYVVEFDPALALTAESEGKYLVRIYAFEAGERQPIIPKRFHKISLVGDSLPEGAMQFITWLAAGEPDVAEARKRATDRREADVTTPIPYHSPRPWEHDGSGKRNQWQTN